MNDNPYQITFPLRQHTPIIHFQHDQAGATLRATELKPKLDRFIMENLLRSKGIAFDFYENVTRSGNMERKFVDAHEAFKRAVTSRQADDVMKKWKGWLVGKGNSEHVAFDYKVAVLQTGESERYLISSMPDSNARDPQRQRTAMTELRAKYLGKTQYFADNQYIDSPEEVKKARLGLISKAEIVVRVNSVLSELVSLIKNEFAGFMASTNFGTRQSKGFGCFLPDKITDEEILRLLKLNPAVKGVFRIGDKTDYSSKLQAIASDYSLLKRGESFRGYQKSRLWKYLCQRNGIRWEKRKIKKHLIAYAPHLFATLKYDQQRFTSNQIDDCDSHEGETNYKYIRALLGLAEQFEFGKQHGNQRLVVKIADRLSARTETKVLAVQRFKSPIRYMVTDSYVYLITTAINPLLHTYHDTAGNALPREFEFKIDEMTTNKTFTLQVPSVFDLEDFVATEAGYSRNLK